MNGPPSPSRPPSHDSARAPSRATNRGRTLPASTGVIERLSALADGTRLRLSLLLEQSELTVGEAAAVLQLPQSTVSRHLKVLADAGWLERRSEGTAALFRLILDELDPSLRALWLGVREQPGLEDERQNDARRLRDVLAQRKLDSVTFFGKHAGEWDELRVNLFGAGFTPLALLATLNPSWTVADLGCGTGNVAELVGPHVKRVIAVDQSDAMLTAARARLRSNTALNNVEFRAGPLERLPLRANEADVSVLALVLHHVEDVQAALNEAARVTKPGGLVLVVDMLAHGREDLARRMGHKHLGFSPETMRKLTKAAGLSEPQFHELPSAAEAKGPGLFVLRATKPPTPKRESNPRVSIQI